MKRNSAEQKSFNSTTKEPKTSRSRLSQKTQPRACRGIYTQLSLGTRTALELIALYDRVKGLTAVGNPSSEVSLAGWLARWRAGWLSDPALVGHKGLAAQAAKEDP